MFEKEVDSSTVSNNVEQTNVSLERRMFSFAPSRLKEFVQNTQEVQYDSRQYIQEILKQNHRLQKQLQTKDQEIINLKGIIKEKDLQIFYLQRSQKQLRKSLETIHIYNQQFIIELDSKNKQLQILKHQGNSREILCTNEIVKVRSKYQVLKQKFYTLKSQSRHQSRNPSEKRPISPKRGTLMNQIKDYVTETKAKVRGESRNRQYFANK